MTGAIFCERRPATIIKSAWRGEGRKTSAPKRATSKRAAAMDIISMAQQARPKPRGQMELLRAQLTALSSVVKIMPSSSSRLPKSSGLVSVTCLPSDVLMGPSYRIIFAQPGGVHKCGASGDFRRATSVRSRRVKPLACDGCRRQPIPAKVRCFHPYVDLDTNCGSHRIARPFRLGGDGCQ